jgi:hypothetical protein
MFLTLNPNDLPGAGDNPAPGFIFLKINENNSYFMLDKWNRLCYILVVNDNHLQIGGAYGAISKTI